MPFNGSGTFSRLYSWAVDAVNNVNISSSRTDAEMNGFAAGLTNCVTRDGQSPPSADLPMGGKKLVNLGAATVGTDALNMATGDARYLLIGGAVSCTTLAASGNGTVGGNLTVTGTISSSAGVFNATDGTAPGLNLIKTGTNAGTASIINTGSLQMIAGATGQSAIVRADTIVFSNQNLSTTFATITSTGATFSIAVSGPTASPGDNSTKYATTAFVASAISASAPSSLSLSGTLGVSGQTTLTGVTGLPNGAAVNGLGYMGAPSTVKTANYALATTDIGQDITFNGTTLTCTIPAGLPNGYVAIIANINASALTITSASDTLTLSGTTTTGNRTLGQNGEARIIRRNGVLYIAGTALS